MLFLLFFNLDIELKDKEKDYSLWEIGDIVYTYWGYSMTIIDYYEIIRKTGKGFVLKGLKDKIVSGNGQRGESVPIPKEYKKSKYNGNVEFDILKARINKNGYLRADNKSVYLWDGKPKSFDHMD